MTQILTETDASGFGNGAVAGLPSSPGGLVWPAPVPNNETIDPLSAGFAELFTLPFWLRMPPCPPEPGMVNTPGDVTDTASVTLFDTRPCHPSCPPSPPLPA